MILLLLALSTTPQHTHVPCWIVRAYLTTLGESGARQKGHENGYTDAEIDAIKARCKLK